MLIAYGSLYPFDFSAAPAGAFLRIFTQATLSGSIGDALGNIALFVPWGLLGLLTFTPRRNNASALFLTFVTGFAIAFFLQILQLWVPSRTPALNDVFWNMFGCAAGASLGYRLSTQRQSLSGFMGLQSAIGYILAAWVVWEWLPLIPSLDFQLLKNHLKELLALESISFAPIFEHVAITLLFGELLSRILKPNGARYALPILAAGIVLGKLFLIDAPLNASIILGFLVGIVSWWAVVRFLADRRVAIVVVALILAYSTSALAPFSFKDTPSSFAWLPFDGLLEGSMLVNIRSLGGNLLLFTSILLLLRAEGSKIGGASVALAFWVLMMEIVQLVISNRSATITEPILVLIAGQLLGALNFSGRTVVHGREQEEQVSGAPNAVSRKQKAASPNYRNALIHTLLIVVAIVAGVKILLALPGVPYNVKELFRSDGSVLAIVAFALSMIWIGAGSVWFGRQLIHSTSPGLILFPLSIAVSLVSLLFLWSGVTSESIHDVVGSPNRYWFVTNKNVWGDLWGDIFRYLNAPGTIGFLESCARYWALYALPSIFLALIYYGQNAGTKLRRARFAKTSLLLAAFLTLWLCKAIAFDWSSTDNLNELIARDGEWGWGGGGYLYALVFLLCLNAHLVADLSVSNTGKLLKAVLFSLVTIPTGWWLINQGLEQNVEKYGNLFSGVQFLLGPDRTHLLSQNTLLARWCLVQVAGVLIVGLGIRLGKNFSKSGPPNV